MENIFINITGLLRNLLGGIGVPIIWTDITLLLVKVLAILVFILLNVMLVVFLERKVSSYMQARIGPNRVGPKGSLQMPADIVKLLSKEITIPQNADKTLFLLAPVLIIVPPIMIFSVIPFGKGMVALDMNIGLFYVFAIASLSTLLFWMGGWGSNNKYSLLGGMRVVAQMVSYEVPMILSVLSIVMLVGSLNLSEIISAQYNVWFIVTQPVAFLVYYVAALAECNRTPFCLLEAESEIITGPYVEYGGMAFAMFYLAENANLMVASALATTLFLGGWLAPFELTFIPSWLWFFLKMYLLIFIAMWFRWTYPRIRIDQLLGFSWKVLIPLSLANIFLTGMVMKIYQAIGW